MKVQIRQGVFETNSSSTHTLCLYNRSEWERFKNGEMVIGNTCYYPDLVEITDEIKDSIFDEKSEGRIWDYDYLTYNVWNNIWDYNEEGWEALEEDVDNTHVVSFYQPG